MINDIDKILKDRLYYTNTEVSPSVWKNIEAALEKKKKRRNILYFLVFYIIFIITFDCIFYIQ